MQNRPGESEALFFEPVCLDRRFPFLLSPNTFCRQAKEWLHIHDVFEIGLCHAGEGFFEIEGKVLPFAAGDVFVVNHREFHHAYSPAGALCVWDFLFVDLPAMFTGTVYDGALLDTAGFSGSHFSNRFTPADSPAICALVAELVQEARSEGPLQHDAVKAVLYCLLIALARSLPEGRPDAASVPERSYQQLLTIKPALDRIVQDYPDPLTVPDLAEACHMSPTHFRRVFTHLMGRSPQDYLNHYRIAVAAAELTHTTTPVARIAAAVGFGDLSAFNRQFQKRKSCSPREWRSAHGHAAS